MTQKGLRLNIPPRQPNQAVGMLTLRGWSTMVPANLSSVSFFTVISAAREHISLSVSVTFNHQRTIGCNHFTPV
ncbi:hypothetical protein P4S55_25110 [Shewanella sp. PP-Sp27a-2]